MSHSASPPKPVLPARALRLAALAGVVASATACSIPRWPVAGTMTSPYGLRMDGLAPEIHRGVDVSVPDGTPVKAMKSGRVRFAGTMAGYGTVVILEHGADLLTYYGHLSELRVERGQDVRGGQVIALSGRSGNASGPHLHFEVRRWGRPADPVPLLGDFPPKP